MKYYTFDIESFANFGDAIEIASRMGWEGELIGGTLTIFFPEEDTSLADFIFEYWAR